MITFCSPFFKGNCYTLLIIKSVVAIIEQVGAKASSDMGKVMGVASKMLEGKADGETISEKVKALLASYVVIE